MLIARKYYIAVFLAAALKVSSLVINITSHDLFLQNRGDIWIYLTWMRCFSEQLWQGDFYPRWCMDVNDGLGTSLFIFYFPLPYYIAALFYPLIQAGMSYYYLFVFLCFIASFLAIISCYSWLKDIVEPRFALLGAILYLFMPYPMEAMYFRGAYSEIWCAVLVPLFFKYARRMVQGKNAMAPLATVIGLSSLTHVPLTASCLIFCGFYICFMTGVSWRPKMQFAASVVLGGTLAAFYILPAEYYHQFLSETPLAQGLYGWPNNYLKFEFLQIPWLERPIIAAGLTMVLFAGFAVNVFLKRRRIKDGFVVRELYAWLAIGLAAIVMVFEISMPLYNLMGPLSKVVFPWRMQMIVTASIIYMLVVWMQWQISQNRQKTWKTDMGLSLFIFWLLGNYLTLGYGVELEALNQKIRLAKIIHPLEYRTKWTDENHYGYEFYFERMKTPTPQAEIIEGKGQVQVTSWNWRGIDLKVNSKKPVVVRLNHSYFPVWSGVLYKTGVVPLQAEAKTGLMLATIPGGEHLVHLSYDVYKNAPNLIISQWLSMAACIGLFLAFLKPKFFDRQAIA